MHFATLSRSQASNKDCWKIEEIFSWLIFHFTFMFSWRILTKWNNKNKFLIILNYWNCWKKDIFLSSCTLNFQTLNSVFSNFRLLKRTLKLSSANSKVILCDFANFNFILPKITTINFNHPNLLLIVLPQIV